MKNNHVKRSLIIILSFLCFITAAKAQEAKRVKPNYINVKSLHDLEKMNLNFCDTFCVEISGLYPITDTLPLAIDDENMVKVNELLLKKGFKKVNSGWGNWDNGPRFIESQFTNGKCQCETFKKWYHYKKQNGGTYNLKVTERIICNAFIDMY